MSHSILIKRPELSDGLAIFQLVEQCPPLDTNSAYCNFLQAGHFGGTSAVAYSQSNELMGSISAYRPPANPNVLFVWQVAVSEMARGHGLAKRMLQDILNRPECDGVAWVHTTITADNQGSWALFKSLAQQLNAPLNQSVWLDKQTHFNGQHDSEFLVEIGPFYRGPSAR